MRKFVSYGSINPKLHYYAPRTALIDQTLSQLLGEPADEGGHYITVWAPRQRGKTWLMQQILWRLQQDDRFDVAKVNLQSLKLEADLNRVIKYIVQQLARQLAQSMPTPDTLEGFEQVFTKDVLDRPLALILDEFDNLSEAAINGLAAAFRNIYIQRQDQTHIPTDQRDYLLHGVALVGVRSVLGVENVTGSPFNVQRSLQVPNLTFAEVESMFKWYEQESGQPVDQAVIERLFYETQGQPGLSCWFGELLTETYNREADQPIMMSNFEEVYAAAMKVLPNNNILNIISKAKQEPYRQFILELFRTDEKIEFTYDHEIMNYLYLNGVIDWERETLTTYYAKFACSFVQKRLFNYFSTELFRDVGKLYGPFEDLSDTITDDSLNIGNLLGRYERYLKQNREWLLRDAPRRKTDLRIYEAIYHFNLYMYLQEFLRARGGQVYPEFPTGNGKVDLIIHYASQVYGLEVKSFGDQATHKGSVTQAAAYGQQLQLSEIWLVLFVDYVDEANRRKYEVTYEDEQTGVMVWPVFVETGV